MPVVKQYVAENSKLSDKQIAEAFNAIPDVGYVLDEKEVAAAKLSIAEDAVRAPLQNLLNTRFERVVNGIVKGTVRNEDDIILVFSE